jgi:hypothetical protein
MDRERMASRASTVTGPGMRLHTKEDEAKTTRAKATSSPFDFNPRRCRKVRMGSTVTGSIQLQDGLESVKASDVVHRCGAVRYARAKRLRGGNGKAPPNGQLGVRIVSNNENLSGFKVRGLNDVFYKPFLAAVIWLVNGIYIYRGEQWADAQRADLAFLKATEPRGDEKKLNTQFVERRKVSIAGHWSSDFHLE